MGLAYRLGHGWPRSLRSASAQASCLRCCRAVAWCRGRRGGRRHDRGRATLPQNPAGMGLSGQNAMCING